VDSGGAGLGRRPDAGIGVRPEELAALPAHADDLNWLGASGALFVDHAILLLFEPEQDGMVSTAKWRSPLVAR
jgi:hypothetical protein